MLWIREKCHWSFNLSFNSFFIIHEDHSGLACQCLYILGMYGVCYTVVVTKEQHHDHYKGQTMHSTAIL